MSLTPNYGMTIPASTDTVNLLTQNYPNFTILDTALKNVSDSAITVAVETKVGTVHNLVRSDGDRAVIRFTATSDYTAGDTFTVDGNAVTVVTPGGTSIPDRGFVINSNVVGVLVGAVLTLLVGGGLTSVDASDVDYDNTVSGLTATNVQDAIDEVVSDIPTGFSASAITYDNTGSGLTATDVQDAIDEVNGKLGKIVALCSPVIPTNGGTVTLSEAYTNFDALIIETSNATSGARLRFCNMQPVVDENFSSGSVYATLVDYTIAFNTPTVGTFANVSGNLLPTKYCTIYGVKF